MNNERVRRLAKLGLMRDEGRKALPDVDPDSFRIDTEMEQRLKEDKQAYENFRRVRIDTTQSQKISPNRSRTDWTNS
ncbi:hypothetical protein BN871_AM_00290 [Paenibacillus sp. P22]|nr:hypothetical protein BN871_AM_00290 [Paenibacillus sp. P22]